MTRRYIQPNTIEPTSHLWQRLLVENKAPIDGTIIEVAPGYEPKIGNALFLLGFCGTIYLIEPDKKAARDIQKIYQEILPHATVKIVTKFLQDVVVGVDVPYKVDVVVASHPFDDMVVASIISRASFFSQEKKWRNKSSASIQKLYDGLKDKDYERGVQTTVSTWRNFIEVSRPNYFIASQYPSHTLTVKGLAKRQNSGFTVLQELKKFYKYFLIERHHENLFDFKGNPKWWIIAKNPCADLSHQLQLRPLAMKRLGKSIFVRQHARRLRPDEYDVVYADMGYFGGRDNDAILQQIKELAIIIDNDKVSFSKKIPTYADRQKDGTDIGLSGNHGSGRAVYYGDRFNILGVGKTTLCKSLIPSHSTGELELIGAMRRIVVSRWINYFTKRVPIHPALLTLKKTAVRKWNKNPIPLALLVRVDNGCLDRPSHIEQSPSIPVDFQKTLTEYAKLDAEYFAYRIMLGAWSTSNYSLHGHVIDLESASFVKYRGPYSTSSSKYPHTLFGYEGLGFLEILRQLASVKKIQSKNMDSQFYALRREHLARCFLSLLGVEDKYISSFLLKRHTYVMNISDQFEMLAKKVSSHTANLNLYTSLADDKDPSLLDMSHLFRNLARLYRSSNAEEKAFKLVIRKTALLQVKPRTMEEPSNQAEAFLQSNAVVTIDQLDNFLVETRKFIHALFQLLDTLDLEKCLSKKEDWGARLHAMNQNIPTMFELNEKLVSLAESYRLGKISPTGLGMEIEKPCDLPRRLQVQM
jgi:hypothetical protein